MIVEGPICKNCCHDSVCRYRDLYDNLTDSLMREIGDMPSDALSVEIKCIHYQPTPPVVGIRSDLSV